MSAPLTVRARCNTLMLTKCLVFLLYCLLLSRSAQQFNVILDTGSSDLWVASNDCQSCPGNIATFDSTKSSSFASQSQQITISYGSGQVAGTVATDTVNMGGFTVSGQTLSE